MTFMGGFAFIMMLLLGVMMIGCGIGMVSITKEMWKEGDDLIDKGFAVGMFASGILCIIVGIMTPFIPFME